MIEEFRDVVDYEGLYKISGEGRVKSLKRRVKWKGTTRFIRERILKTAANGNGYLHVTLYNGFEKTMTIHALVAQAFLNHKPNGTQEIEVDHIDRDKLNNRVENLQLLTNREHHHKDPKPNKSSKFMGVCWHKRDKKWIARIQINGKDKALGYFKYEIDAAYAYQEALSKL